MFVVSYVLYFLSCCALYSAQDIKELKTDSYPKIQNALIKQLSAQFSLCEDGVERPFECKGAAKGVGDPTLMDMVTILQTHVAQGSIPERFEEHLKLRKKESAGIGVEGALEALLKGTGFSIEWRLQRSVLKHSDYYAALCKGKILVNVPFFVSDQAGSDYQDVWWNRAGITNGDINNALCFARNAFMMKVFGGRSLAKLLQYQPTQKEIPILLSILYDTSLMSEYIFSGELPKQVMPSEFVKKECYDAGYFYRDEQYQEIYQALRQRLMEKVQLDGESASHTLMECSQKSKKVWGDDIIGVLEQCAEALQIKDEENLNQLRLLKEKSKTHDFIWEAYTLKDSKKGCIDGWSVVVEDRCKALIVLPNIDRLSKLELKKDKEKMFGHVLKLINEHSEQRDYKEDPYDADGSSLCQLLGRHRDYFLKGHLADYDRAMQQGFMIEYRSIDELEEYARYRLQALLREHSLKKKDSKDIREKIKKKLEEYDKPGFYWGLSSLIHQRFERYQPTNIYAQKRRMLSIWKGLHILGLIDVLDFDLNPPAEEECCEKRYQKFIDWEGENGHINKLLDENSTFLLIPFLLYGASYTRDIYFCARKDGLFSMGEWFWGSRHQKRLVTIPSGEKLWCYMPHNRLNNQGALGSFLHDLHHLWLIETAQIQLDSCADHMKNGMLLSQGVMESVVTDRLFNAHGNDLALKTVNYFTWFHEGCDVLPLSSTRPLPLLYSMLCHDRQECDRNILDIKRTLKRKLSLEEGISLEEHEKTSFLSGLALQVHTDHNLLTSTHYVARKSGINPEITIEGVALFLSQCKGESYTLLLPPSQLEHQETFYLMHSISPLYNVNTTMNLLSLNAKHNAYFISFDNISNKYRILLLELKGVCSKDMRHKS